MSSIKQRIVGILRQEDTVQLLREIREGIANQPDEKKVEVLSQIRDGIANQSSLLNDKLTKIAEELAELNARLREPGP